MSELRKRGLASAVVCSEPFVRFGATQAEVLGTPGLPLVRIPHPVGGVPIGTVRERAAVAIPQVVALILENAK